MTGEYYKGAVTQRGVVFEPGGDVLLVSAEARPWTFPGGRIEADASPESALRREIRREIGLHVTVEQPVGAVTNVWGSGDEPVYAVLFHCEARNRDVELGEERDDWCWFTPEGAMEEAPVPSLEAAIERAAAIRENTVDDRHRR